MLLLEAQQASFSSDLKQIHHYNPHQREWVIRVNLSIKPSRGYSEIAGGQFRNSQSCDAGLAYLGSPSSLTRIFTDPPYKHQRNVPGIIIRRRTG